ncbi:MAG TPA: MaoC family dehydratase [Steroidobacteraceae bacterium]|nr:MaoC family dehydratase [Steroidobacteraceae bacterium]
MAGRFYEDWTVGDRIEHALRRTVTETDNLLITTLTHNVQPLHLDAEAAAASEFGRILVNSVFTFGLMVGVSVADTTLGVLIANLGYDQVLLPKPVFVGDTLHGDTTVAELRESRSRPHAGIVSFAHRMLNQHDEVVCTCMRTALIRKKPA